MFYLLTYLLTYLLPKSICLEIKKIHLQLYEQTESTKTRKNVTGNRNFRSVCHRSKRMVSAYQVVAD